jgi:hypothetical protein
VVEPVPRASGGGGAVERPVAPRYLEGDLDVWGIADRLAPPVIGDNGDA